MSKLKLREIERATSEEVLELEQQVLSGKDIFGLDIDERRWAAYYPYLAEKGYQLRPRYRTGWVRSWQGTKFQPDVCEDGWTATHKLTMDAVRVADNQQVMIKKLLPSPDNSGNDGRKELDIIQYFSSNELVSDPRNHSMPYIESFPIPDVDNGFFLISPLLVPWNRPPFETMGEVTDFIGQIFEGLAFLHDHNVAHRDCRPPNIMMDCRKMIDEQFHPIRNNISLDGTHFLEVRTRTQSPVRYYFIDFGISTRFKSLEDRGLVTGIDGREQGVPELSISEPYDPFKVDIFILGAFVNQDLVKRFSGMGFLKPLLSSMTSLNPKDRPPADQVVEAFRELVANLPPRTLALPLVPRDSGLFATSVFAFQNFIRQSIFSFQKLLRRWSMRNLLRAASRPWSLS